MKRRDLPVEFIKRIGIPRSRGVYIKYTSSDPSQIEATAEYNIPEKVTAFQTIRDFPESPIADDISELKQTTLDIARKNQRIIELLSNLPNIQRELSEIKMLIEPKARDITTDHLGVNQLVQEYIELIKVIEVAKQIYLFRSSGCHYLWTVIDAPPFEDEQRYPVYEAQMKIFSKNSKDNPVDFYLINVKELSEAKRLEDVLPVNSTLIWKHE